MEYPCAFFILVKTRPRPRPTVPNYKYNELQADMYTYGTVYTVTSLNTFRSDLVPVHIINYDGKNKGKTNLKRMKRENVRTLSICCQQRICIQQYTVLGVGRKCTRLRDNSSQNELVPSPSRPTTNSSQNATCSEHKTQTWNDATLADSVEKATRLFICWKFFQLQTITL